MTRTQARLAELSAIRDRSLTEDEQREVERLAKIDRKSRRWRERYRADPEFRRAMLLDAERRRRLSGNKSKSEVARARQRDEAGRFA